MLLMAKRKNPAAVQLGKRGASARMKKLTPEQRSAVAKNAASARWAKPVTQADLKRQSTLQAAEWETDRVAQMGAEDINTRLAGGATMEPGKLVFDKKLKMATARHAVPVVATKRSKRPAKEK